MVRVFADDFAKATAPRVRTVAGRDGASDPLDYVRRAFVISDGSRALALRGCGTRRAGELLWICLETELPRATAGLRLRNAMLVELFEDQVNIVRSLVSGAARSTLFTRGDGQKALP